MPYKQIFDKQIKSLDMYYGAFKSDYQKYVELGNVDDDLRRFYVRSSVICNAQITLNNDSLTEQEKVAQIYTLRLSEAWFAYEALIPCFAKYNCHKKAMKTQTKRNRNVKTIREALIQPINVCDEDPPYGKAGYFDYEFSSDWNMLSLLEDDLEVFLSYIHLIINNNKSREYFHKYLDYLEANALGDQKRYILNAHNDINNKSEITPTSILCISYAIRNQYVHSGEIIDSKFELPEVKAELLKACYNFTMCNSFAVADAMITAIM